MMKILPLLVSFSLVSPRSQQFRQKEAEKFETEIMESWADEYVEAFFQPSLPSTVEFSLDQLYVQRDGEKNSSLYTAATKYNFYSEPLLSASRLTDVFQTEAKLVEKSGGQEVSQELQIYLLGRLFSAPRIFNSEHSKTISSYLTIKLGRLGLYTVNQKFQFVNVFDGMTEESGWWSEPSYFIIILLSSLTTSQVSISSV